MTENMKSKINPISLKKQTEFFFKKIKPSKIANNYINNLRKKLSKTKKNNTLQINSINSKYLIKISNLSKLSDLNNDSNRNQFSSNLEKTFNTIQNMSTKFNNKKILNFKKIRNIKGNIKLNYSKNFTSVLSKRAEELKTSDNIKIKNKILKNKNIHKNLIELKNANSNVELSNSHNINRIKHSKNINEVDKRQIADILNYYNTNSSLINTTISNNTINSNCNLNSNSVKKGKSPLQNINKTFINERLSSNGNDFIKYINIQKKNKILNRLQLNKDNKENKNININIKYFFKKNISNINWIVYNSYNNINFQKIPTEKYEHYKHYIKLKKNNNNKTVNNLRENNLYKQRKSLNDINTNKLKINHLSMSQNANSKAFKEKKYSTNINILNNYKIKILMKGGKLISHTTLKDLSENKNLKTLNKLNSSILNRLLSKSLNKKKINLKKIVSKSLKKASLKTVNLSLKKLNDIKINKISERSKNMNNILPINNICRNDRKIKSVNCFNKKKDKLRIDNNCTLTEFKTFKSNNNKKEENLNLYNTKENIDINVKNKYHKRNTKNLFLNHNINIKKMYNDIKLALKRQKEKEKGKIKKQQLISNDVHIILPNHNYIQDFSNSKNEYALNSENITNKSVNNIEDEICEIESITKRLDFTKYNNVHCGDIFYVYNNKEYNDFKSNFDKGFNKKISAMKMINDFNSNSFINNISKKIK